MGSVLVTGDIVLDYHIYEGRRKHYGDGVSPGVRIVSQAGGAALIHDLLEELMKQESSPRWASHLAVETPKATLSSAAIDTAQHAYAFWRPFPENEPEDKQHWLVSEKMGFGAVQAAPPCESWTAAERLPDEPDIIVLSDGGMGFRGTADCWIDLDFGVAKWIVLKTASPFFTGELWEKLSRDDEIVKKLVIVVSARELRKSTARISSGLSWEETIENLLRDLQGNLQLLRRCRHLIVAFESEGGIWIDFAPASDNSHCKVHFVYDPPTIEGDHAQSPRAGDAFGFLSCLTAAVAWQLVWHRKLVELEQKSEDDNPDLAAALEGGLSAMRNLREEGHGPAAGKAEGFPAQRLANVIQLPRHRYSIATFSCDGPIDANGSANIDWSILRESRRLLSSKTRAGSQSDLARLVVMNGPIALANLPQLQIGKLLSVDRHEIETLRTISQLIRDYRDHDSGKRPLSLGVFGPPGSGKSFAVQELAEMLGKKGAWREFNLSQFKSPDDLIGAFHQIRDLVLKDLLPLAFFDEFDSQKFRWLQYLLAPMQDGKFQEGQLSHPLGKCILIFAGGTSWSFETLGPPVPTACGCDAHILPDTKDLDEFRLAKGPDFKSRLDGYLNVIGPNQRKVSPPAAGTKPEHLQRVAGYLFGDDRQDAYFRIRRALMIRSFLKCEIDHKLKIDEGLLHALLNTPTYNHGSRSLEKILQPLKSAMPDTIHRSSLAPRGQLDMHTQAGEFIKLLDMCPVESVPALLPPDDIEAIAPAIHETWNQLVLKEGTMTPGTEKAFTDLDEFDQRSNRAAAERMPKVLALIGLTLAEGVARPTEVQEIRQQIEYHLELLADAEHDHWMRWHYEQGWRHGKQKDKAMKLHNCLIRYRELKDEDKNKDRTQVRAYPDFAARAGKKIVFD